MKMLQKSVRLWVLIAALLAMTTIVAAQTFYFVFNQTVYKPSEYSWSELWEVKEKIDFVEALLTLTGPGYEGEPHDVELVIKNVATESNYVITNLDYQADWTVGAGTEVIIGGSYSGALAVNETVTYAGTFTPAIIGTGNLGMHITNIIWAKSESIIWIKDTSITGPYSSDVSVMNFEITGATMSVTEPGTVSFTIKENSGINTVNCDYKVEIVEASITISEDSDSVPASGYKDYSFDFDPVPIGGDLTMLITITTK